MKIKSKKYNKTMVLLIVLLALIASIAVWWFFLHHTNKSSVSGPDAVTNGGTDINYNPPTQQETTQGDEKKQNLDNNQGSNSQDNNTKSTVGSSKSNVTIVVTDAGYYDDGVEISGYAEKVIEKDGVCTATLTKGSTTVTQQKVALDDAQYTSCGVVVIPKSKLTSGTWKVVLKYESSSSSGVSASREVVVP